MRKISLDNFDLSLEEGKLIEKFNSFALNNSTEDKENNSSLLNTKNTLSDSNASFNSKNGFNSTFASTGSLNINRLSKIENKSTISIILNEFNK
jgi:hypothetical protein